MYICIILWSYHNPNPIPTPSEKRKAGLYHYPKELSVQLQRDVILQHRGLYKTTL
jgi:hypothetical protein